MLEEVKQQMETRESISNTCASKKLKALSSRISKIDKIVKDTMGFNIAFNTRLNEIDEYVDAIYEITDEDKIWYDKRFDETNRKISKLAYMAYFQIAIWCMVLAWCMRVF